MSWAPGVFHRRLERAVADLVADPLCPSDTVAAVLADRYLAAVGEGATTHAHRMMPAVTGSGMDLR